MTYRGQASLGKCDIRPNKFEKTLLACCLVLIDGGMVSQRLGSGCDQKDNIFKAEPKLGRIRDDEEHKGLKSLGKSLATLEHDT